MNLSPQPPRKRDRIRDLFRRSPSPLPVRTVAASSVTSSQGTAYATTGSSILADALEALERDDRDTIRTLLPPANATSIDTAFDEVLGLFDQVDKVVQLLDKFKAVGDVVANVDPVHVGLPWAAIRAVLEVCIYQWDIA
jgi:hypothetical protein